MTFKKAELKNLQKLADDFKKLYETEIIEARKKLSGLTEILKKASEAQDLRKKHGFNKDNQ